MAKSLLPQLAAVCLLKRCYLASASTREARLTAIIIHDEISTVFCCPFRKFLFEPSRAAPLLETTSIHVGALQRPPMPRSAQGEALGAELA